MTWILLIYLGGIKKVQNKQTNKHSQISSISGFVFFVTESCVGKNDLQFTVWPGLTPFSSPASASPVPRLQVAAPHPAPSIFIERNRWWFGYGWTWYRKHSHTQIHSTLLELWRHHSFGSNHPEKPVSDKLERQNFRWVKWTHSVSVLARDGCLLYL